MRVLAVVNQKGGCGKTTTAVHVASRWAATGRPTLLVDLDPQGHATLGLGRPAPEPERSLARVLSRSGLDEQALRLEDILDRGEDGLLVARSGAELAELETRLAGAPGGEERLAEHLAPLAGTVDRVVVDAPPSLGMLTLNALTAATELVVPVEPSLFALHGLARLTELVRLVEDRAGGRRRTVHVLITAYDGRSKFARATLDEVRRRFPAETLATVVRASVRVREAAALGLGLERHAPRSAVAADMRALADELDARAALPAPEAGLGLRVAPEGLYLTRHDVPPEAVRIAGDFNGWEPDAGVTVERHPGGGWTKFLPVAPGRYEYKLVVGGRWIADPLNARRVQNDIGSENSVLEVGRVGSA